MARERVFLERAREHHPAIIAAIASAIVAVIAAAVVAVIATAVVAVIAATVAAAVAASISAPISASVSTFLSASVSAPISAGAVAAVAVTIAVMVVAIATTATAVAIVVMIVATVGCWLDAIHLPPLLPHPRVSLHLGGESQPKEAATHMLLACKTRGAARVGHSIDRQRPMIVTASEVVRFRWEPQGGQERKLRRPVASADPDQEAPTREGLETTD